MTAIHYMHQTPGRLRLKGRHFQCHGERARQAVQRLQTLSGVSLVKLNPHAGSLTIQYEPRQCSQAELLAVLEDAGCLHAASLASAQAARPAGSEGVAGAFGKALVGALAQRTATKLLGALL